MEAFRGSPARYTIFPEAAGTGFPYDELERITALNQQFLEKIKSIAGETGRGLILPLLWRDGERYVNRIFVISWTGSLLGTYDKIHLIGALNEDRYLTPGKKTMVLDLDFPDSTGIPPLRTGFATCYDLRFPELFRRLVLEEGARLLILPAFWPVARADHFRILQEARAVENQVSLLSCNATGRWGRLDLAGGSLGLNAKGEIVASLGREEGFIDFTPDLTLQQKWREDFPVLPDSTWNKQFGGRNWT